MPSIQTVAPTAEPVSLAEAKLHLRVDINDDDSLIAALISAARLHAETITRRAIPAQTWKLVLDEFPHPASNLNSATWYGPQWGVMPGPLSTARPDGSTGYEIYLLPPLQSVTSIKYYDSNGIQQTLDPSAYLVDVVSEPGRITPAPNTTWPATQARANAIEIIHVTGYASVPEGIKAWMKIRVATMYENREEVALMNRGKIEPLPYVDALLDPYRVLKF